MIDKIKVKIRKWGNSFVAIVPKGFVNQEIIQPGKIYELSTTPVAPNNAGKRGGSGGEKGK